MKRFLISFAFFALVMWGSIWGVGFTQRTYGNLEKTITQAEDALRIGDADAARHYCEEAEKYYVDREGLLTAFVSRDTVNDIGEILSALPPLATLHTGPEFFSHTGQARVTISHLKNYQIPRIYNIF